MGFETETLFDEPTFYMGRLQNLGFVIWRETPTVQRVDKVTSRLGVLEHFPGAGFAMMVVITPACVPVGPEVRKAFDGGLRTHRNSAMGFAAVIEVRGVLGGLTRAIARTLNIVTRSPFPVNTYGNVSDAAEWLPHIVTQRGAPALPRQVIIDEVNGHRRFTPP